MKMKTRQPKPMGFSKSSAKGKVHSNTGIAQEIFKKVKKKKNNLTLHLKQLEKGRNEEPQC